MEGNIQAASNGIENENIELETLMTEKLDRLSPMSPSRCIFRVPDRLRRVCKEAYTPRVISIGPLHHGEEDLKAMEEHKMRYLQYFLRHRTNNLSLKDCIKKIKDKELELRSWYSETIDLESDKFVRIILVDTIFIIEFLVRYCGLQEDQNDCIFGKPNMFGDVWPDLLILENQLPFFILEEIFNPEIFHVPSFLFLSCCFLDGAIATLRGMLHNLGTISSSQVEVQHFVDLLRKLCTPPTQSARRSKITTAPSIAKLHLAGVKFKVGSTKNLFDIQFKDGILEIPKFKATDSTELILRNLVAFEQCTLFEEQCISEYVAIMDMFVDTLKDVELLVKYRIVENLIGGGDNELSTMINSLGTGVIFLSGNFNYGPLCEDLNEFCNLMWHKRMAILKQNYFNTPWAIISFLAAVLLLILTVVQSICSIISLS